MPEVPGIFELAWLLFMQPLRLHELFVAWGLEEDPSLWKLRGRLKAREPVATCLARRLAVVLLVGAPALAIAVSGLPILMDVPVVWGGVTLGVGYGVAYGMVGCVALYVAGGVAQGAVTSMVGGAALGVTLGITGGVAEGVTGDVAGGVAGGATIGAMMVVERSLRRGVASDVASGVVLSLITGVALGGVALGVAGGVAACLACALAYTRAPLYLGESLWTWGSTFLGRIKPSLAPWVARKLPFLHHDLIYFPLPGLHRFLIDLGSQTPELALDLIEKAARSPGQKGPARKALAELQALALERAATERRWGKATTLDLAFLPGSSVDQDSPLVHFRDAARDLHAARETRDHQRRRKALARAREGLTGLQVKLASQRALAPLDRRLQITARRWLEVVDDELHLLAREGQEHPQVPRVFRTGEPLDPREDAGLFKGRSENILLIDHDLADDRRAPLVLLGQRRMGKTSLVRMLPARLGTGTTVVPLNFQKLSGQPHRDYPHRWLAEELASKLPGLPKHPDQATWSQTLDWLQKAEAALDDKRVLLAIDEVERVADGIREGWTTPAFLDFLRAAGDSLRRVRILLVSAHPFHRLGREWTDRLISVVQREISYLRPAEAEELIRKPAQDFPDIYPPGGVERIVHETRGHPYLIQFVCDALVRDAAVERQRQATDADLTRAFDRTLRDTVLFRELWSDRTDDERTLLRQMAKEQDAPISEGTALRELVQQGYVEPREGRYAIAVPLFRTWIRENT